MGLNFERVLLFLLSILTLSSAANTAANTSCLTFDPSIYNATGAITFPGFELNKHNPPLTSNNTWRLTTGVFTYLLGSTSPKHPGTLTQEIWLDTAAGSTPPLSSIPPYTACLIFLSRNASAASPLPSTPIPSSPDCAGLFSSACHTRVIQTATDTLLAELKGTTFSSSSSQGANSICDRFADTVYSNLQSSCPDPGDRAQSWGPFTGVGPLFLDTYAPCVANSAGGGESIIGVGYDETAASEQGMDTAIPSYENLVKQPTPVLLTAWWKEEGKGGAMWADSRFVCVTADRKRVGTGPVGINATSATGNGARVGGGRLDKMVGLVVGVGAAVAVGVGLG